MLLLHGYELSMPNNGWKDFSDTPLSTPRDDGVPFSGSTFAEAGTARLFMVFGSTVPSSVNRDTRKPTVNSTDNRNRKEAVFLHGRMVESFPAGIHQSEEWQILQALQSNAQVNLEKIETRICLLTEHQGQLTAGCDVHIKHEKNSTVPMSHLGLLPEKPQMKTNVRVRLCDSAMIFNNRNHGPIRVLGGAAHPDFPPDGGTSSSRRFEAAVCLLRNITSFTTSPVADSHRLSRIEEEVEVNLEKWTGCQPGMAKRADAGPIEAGSMVVATTRVTIGGLECGLERCLRENVRLGKPISLRVKDEGISSNGLVDPQNLELENKDYEQCHYGFVINRRLPNTVFTPMWDTPTSHRCKHGLYVAIYVGVFPLSTRALFTTRKIASNDTHCVSSKGSDNIHLYVIEALMLVQMRTIIKFENGGTNLNRYKSHVINI
ncbi:hypothetical protein LXL04_026566 [Taraxacum kok-saghyz]